MNRIFSHYTQWEDYQAGMYEPCKDNRTERVQMVKTILGNTRTCRKAMKRVIMEWKYATDFNLSFKGQNRRAWLGQAACCIHAGIREDETREGWGLLTDEERQKANEIAEELINDYCNNHMGQISLFEVWGNDEKTVRH